MSRTRRARPLKVVDDSERRIDKIEILASVNTSVLAMNTASSSPPPEVFSGSFS